MNTVPLHGDRTPSASTYNNQKCRCDLCKAAWRENHQRYLNAHPEQREKARQREAAYRQSKKDRAGDLDLRVRLIEAHLSRLTKGLFPQAEDYDIAIHQLRVEARAERDAK